MPTVISAGAVKLQFFSIFVLLYLFVFSFSLEFTIFYFIVRSSNLKRVGPDHGQSATFNSIYQYSNMAPRLSVQTSVFGVVFFVSKSRLGIERQKKLGQ